MCRVRATWGFACRCEPVTRCGLSICMRATFALPSPDHRACSSGSLVLLPSLTLSQVDIWCSTMMAALRGTTLLPQRCG